MFFLSFSEKTVSVEFINFSAAYEDSIIGATIVSALSLTASLKSLAAPQPPILIVKSSPASFANSFKRSASVKLAPSDSNSAFTEVIL